MTKGIELSVGKYPGICTTDRGVTNTSARCGLARVRVAKVCLSTLGLYVVASCLDSSNDKSASAVISSQALIRSLDRSANLRIVGRTSSVSDTSSVFARIGKIPSWADDCGVGANSRSASAVTYSATI